MKLLKKLSALLLSVSMLATVAVMPMNVSAIKDGGAIKTDDYTIGVDLSVFNVGGSSIMDYDAVDFAKMKADGCDFAIIRLGFEGSATGTDTLDLAFKEYYNRAREAGMKLGAYFFSRGTSYAEGKQDAEWVISVIEENDMYFEYPICYDVEADVHYAATANQITNLCYGWAETLEMHGYYPAVYANSQISEKISADFKSEYDIWLRYIKSDGEFDVQYDPATLNISDRCSLWQYTMYQRFDGCSYEYTGKNQIDGNVSYKGYASIMSKNGYNNCGANTNRNLATNKPYTTDIECDPSYTALLTDGIASILSPEADPSAWTCVGQGPIEDAETCERCNGNVIIDLGAVYDITNVAAHIYKDENPNCLTSIGIEFSIDGVNFTEICGTDLNYETTAPYWSTADISNVKELAALDGIIVDTNARYVKFAFSSSESASDCISFINELEVYGNLVGETSNIALDKKVTAPNAVRGYTANLVDGKVANTFATGSSDWYGLFFNQWATDQNCPTGVATIEIDLYQPCALDEIKVHHGSGSGVAPLDGVKVFLSNDGENYSTVTVLDKVNSDAVGWFTADLSGMVARYVKLEVVVDASGYWGMLDEIEVYGIEPEGTPLRGNINDDDMIDKKDYALLKRVCFGATDIDAEKMEQADVNADGEVDKKDYALLKRFCFGAGNIDDPYVY